MSLQETELQENSTHLHEEEKIRLNPNPLDHSNIFSRLIFEFVTPLLYRGFKKTVNEEDVWDQPATHRAAHLKTKLDVAWEKHKSKKWALFISLHNIFAIQFWFAGILLFLSELLSLISPLILQRIIRYLEASGADAEKLNPFLHGYIYVIALFAVLLVSHFLAQHAYNRTALLGMDIRSVLSAKLYHKSLLLSNKAKQQRQVGEIVNLMSTDIARIAMNASFQLHWSWVGTFKLIACLVMLFTLIQWSSLVGVVIMVLVFPIQTVVYRFVFIFRKKLLTIIDKRVKTITEAIQGIRVIKFFTWESAYVKKITDIRWDEIKVMIKLKTIRALIGSLMFSSPIVVSVATFGVYAIWNPLRVDIIFPALGYFTMMRMPMTYLAMIFNAIAEAVLSLNRLQSFLLDEEITRTEPGFDTANPIKVLGGCFEWDAIEKKKDEKDIKTKKGKKGKQKAEAKKKEPTPTSPSEGSTDTTISPVSPSEGLLSVEVDGGSVTSTSAEPKQKPVGKLKDLTFQVKKGSLTFIVGKVASGKSSLLQALIGEMKQIAGELDVTGSIAYCPQQAWIRNATLRDNILFGKKFKQELYDSVVDLCCLRSDLDILPAGDLTEIGEKGINLSGGQKQRVSLARAVYCNRDIYLLDDVLSALDAHVGRSIFETCIMGHLKDKTRVFVTHQLQYLKYATDILVLDEGEIIERGTYEELMSKSFGHLNRLVTQHVQTEDKEEAAGASSDNQLLLTTPMNATASDSAPSEQPTGSAQNETKKKPGSSKLMQDEERNRGAVSLKVFYYYIQKLGGIPILLLILLLFTVAQLGGFASDAFIAMWTSNKLTSFPIPALLGMYAATGALGVVLYFVRDLFATYASVYASYKIHKAALSRLLRAPMSFFETTPAGRIISRFSKDFEQIDFMVPMSIKDFIGAIASIIVSISIMVYSAPFFIIALIPIMIMYFLIQEFYRRTYRELNRLKSNLRSPLYAHFTESLYGLSTIRAYKREDKFLEETNKRIDKVESVSLTLSLMQSWLSLRFEFLGALLIAFAGFFVITSKGFVPTGVAALALTYSFQITQVLQWLLSIFIESEAAFNSVERLMYYEKKIDQEPPEYIEEFCPSLDWPTKGHISFDNFSLKYRPELPYVLKNISLKIEAGQKIGIVGRTGSGKSSLMLGLYRMTDVAEGSITIDGEDTLTMGVRDARRAITIIPQDPLLFGGTIRSNLDPFNEYPDRHLWSVLEKAHMKDHISRLPEGLEAPVSEGGENFSVGQRQLLCLARALTKDSRILILDEATASVDFDTDALIQRTVREEFKDRTLLTIAHRLNTITDADKILVLKNGGIVEFDTPKNLITNQQSEFYYMVQQTGEANASKLYSMIMEHQ